MAVALVVSGLQMFFRGIIDFIFFLYSRRSIEVAYASFGTQSAMEGRERSLKKTVYSVSTGPVGPPNPKAAQCAAFAFLIDSRR
jgi:hypothetical protein